MNIHTALSRQWLLSSVFTLVMALPVFASSTPKALAPYLKKDKTVAGEVGAIVPPKEISKYIAIVRKAAKKNPDWHKEYAKKAKPGVPLPWHENLGLTKEQYEDYLKLWGQREFKTLQKVWVRLEEPKKGEWMIRVSGIGMAVSLLRYDAKSDVFKSTNGELKRIEDIDAKPESILGAWKGKEWRYQNETDFVSTKENFALGKYKDGKHCLLIYRLQESTSGHLLVDKSLVVRFSPPK